MARSDELLNFDVAALASKLRAKEISPVELTDAYLARIETTDARIRVHITVTADLALAAAKRAESKITGKRRGPFHGVPVALRTFCYTTGIRTTAGSKILAEFVPISTARCGGVSPTRARYCSAN
jgi:aspartyl-tRNA(Asn)/glutamyl-tRNA(Gln) amidotransferase subunit A